MGHTDARLQLSECRSTPESVTHGLIPHAEQCLQSVCFPH